jgi:phospholipase/carboxylesterase
MHGFGAPGTDLVGLWRVLDVPRSVRFAFPEAPNEIPGMPGARAWWSLDLARAERAIAEGPRSYANEIPPGMEDATDQVVEMIQTAQTELGVPNEQLIVGGFSQGSMAACNAVFTRNLSPAGLVILSGTPVNLAAWKVGMASCGGLPVFQSHGQQDALLSFEAAKDLNDEMRVAGLATEWVPSFRCRCSPDWASSCRGSTHESRLGLADRGVLRPRPHAARHEQFDAVGKV